MSEDPVSDVLKELGRAVEGDSLAAADALLRTDAASASAFLERLGPRVPREPGVPRGRALVALGTAYLVRRENVKAQTLLAEAVSLLEREPRAGGRGWLRLASTEVALGRRGPARTAVARGVLEVMGLGEDALARELGAVLVGIGETLSTLLEHVRREAAAQPAGDRFQILARLLRALNSAASGTSEPLYAILRAILEETQADRGFLMVYDADTLRFELGLAKTGHRLGPSDFAFSTTIVERALESGRAVVIPDVSAALPVAASESARELGPRGGALRPAQARAPPPRGRARRSSLPQVHNIAGVLYVDSTTAGRFRESDARFFEVLADGAVLALRARAALARPVASDVRGGSEPRLAAERHGRTPSSRSASPSS